jgi:hypothetical protein
MNLEKWKSYLRVCELYTILEPGNLIRRPKLNLLSPIDFYPKNEQGFNSGLLTY